MKPLRVLIATYDLSLRGGTQMYVRDLATGLLNRGHAPIVYSPQLGDVAEEIKELGIAVTDDLSSIADAPDVIHGNHSLETVTSLLQFPRVPAIQTVHGSFGFLSAAPKLSRILRYTPVDFTCYERIVSDRAIPEDRLRVIFNGVDLERFKTRGDLPPRASKAANRPLRAALPEAQPFHIERLPRRVAPSAIFGVMASEIALMVCVGGKASSREAAAAVATAV